MEEKKLKSAGEGVNGEEDDVKNRLEEDRISILPDEVIHRILSFNDTKYAVQASVLSSRWKFVWQTLPYLSFSSWEFRILPKFSKFVNRVLCRRNHRTQVISVGLSYRGRLNQKFVEKIASYARSHNVEKVEIFAQYPPPKGDRRFPLCLFSSESLKRLKIKSPSSNVRGDVFPLPQFPWNFPALTTLCLEDIWLCDYLTKTVELFSKCVNLKNLTLKDCGTRSLEGLTIITPRLENLSITSTSRPISRLVVSAPNLSSFYYDGRHNTLVLSAGNLQFLDKVNLQLTGHLLESKEGRQMHARELFPLFEELCSAKFLTLHFHTIEALATVPALLATQPSPFNNLKCLEIKGFENKKNTSVDSANHVIRYLLNSSPTAAVIVQLSQEHCVRKRLDALIVRMRIDAKALSLSHNKEREAQIAIHKEENEAFHELLMERRGESSGWIAKYRRWIEKMDAIIINKRKLADGKTLLERHSAERLALMDRHKAEISAMIAEREARIQEHNAQVYRNLSGRGIGNSYQELLRGTNETLFRSLNRGFDDTHVCSFDCFF